MTMGQLSSILRNAEGGRLMFWCPGCAGSHQVAVGEGPGPRWGYNGNAERPTFTPSVLVRGVQWDTGDHFFEPNHAVAPGAETVCHSFITDGRIQFLSDCTHSLVGQTVDLPPWPGRGES